MNRIRPVPGAEKPGETAVQLLKILASSILFCVLAGLGPDPAAAAPGDKSTVVQLETSGAVTSPSVIDYRWADLGQNVYAQTYIDTYSYDDATVTVSYETGEPTFTGHLSATNLKPNFAYQLKLVGKPEALFDPLTEGGDDVANERIGYVGRWWEVAPGTGNRNDAYYETYKDNPAYVFEAYLLFDFFLTDSDGAAELDFALDSSYHVLFWDWQGSQGSCDHPLKATTVSGLSTDPAYDGDVGPTAAGVYPQIERLCNGTTALPQGDYHCRILLTEESFHTSDGNWAPAMINDDVAFAVGEGLFPPAVTSEPAYSPGTENTVAWSSVTGATEYFAECSTAADFATVHASSGSTAGLAHTFSGLIDGQIYYYRVKAGDGGTTESAWSAAVSSTQDAVAPASSVDALPASHLGTELSVPYTATDAVGGVAYVELYFRVDGGAYTRYGTSFVTGPIDFAIPGDGDYDFYTVATDNAGNVETPPGTPDASSDLTVGAPPDPVYHSDYIDIGTLATEGQTAMGDPPRNMVGWGPTAPGTIGGNYGGISPGSCRPVWSPTEFDLPHEPWADIDLDFGPAGGTKTLWVRYLDGASTDDQTYSIEGYTLGSIETGDPGENWYWADFDVSGYDGYHTLRIEATQTDPPGTFWDPYGQVAIDILTVCGEEALFAALPADADPVACGQSKPVAFHFTRGCESLRGYSLRVRSADGLSFDDGDVTVHDPSGTGDVTVGVDQNAADDWTITYSINGDSALPDGIPSDVDLFTVDFQGVSDGAGQVIIESVTVDPIHLVPPLVPQSAGATITVDCAAPAGAFQINGGAAATNDLAVNLGSSVTDATPLQMRFVNGPDTWSGSEDGWLDYAAVHFWTLASGADGSRTVKAEYRDAVGLVLATDATITYSSNGPAAVTVLSAEPGKSEIRVTWLDPPDLDIVGLEVWRGLWYDDDQAGASAYPEYGGLDHDVVPTRPLSRAQALASPQWELAGSVLPGEEAFTDVDGPGGLVRGVYYYEVFAGDAEGFYGPPATEGDRATSYLLGDLDGDGAITIGPDITAGLALCYGTVDGDPSFDGECDVGPTDDYSGTGVPLPDDAIGFSDLMIVALNFDTVFIGSESKDEARAAFAWREGAAGVWSLDLVETGVGLKGLNLRADLPAGGVLAVAAGELLTGRDCPYFLQNIDRHGLDTGLALLGDGARILGAGELLRVTLAEGHVPAEVTVDARDGCNESLPCEVEIAPGQDELPVVHRVLTNYPNPFNPVTRIDFELPRAETVELTVFGLDGRRIATLVDQDLPAGRHTATWTGRDDHGETVASGIYMYRLRAGAYAKTCKMTLLK